MVYNIFICLRKAFLRDKRMKKYYLSGLIAFLIGLTIFSVYQYAAFLNERNELLAALEQAQGEVRNLESQKEGLRKEVDSGRRSLQKMQLENAGLKDSLRNDIDEFSRLNTEIKTIQKQAGFLQDRLTLLLAEKESLNSRLAEVTDEKETLRVAFDSVSDLKKRIRELKGYKRRSPDQAMAQADNKDAQAIAGNQGYLMREGKVTYTPKVRIEVEPVMVKQ